MDNTEAYGGTVLRETTAEKITHRLAWFLIDQHGLLVPKRALSACNRPAFISECDIGREVERQGGAVCDTDILDAFDSALNVIEEVSHVSLPTPQEVVAWEVASIAIDAFTKHPRERRVLFESQSAAQLAADLIPGAKIETFGADDIPYLKQCESCARPRVTSFVECDDCHSHKVSMLHRDVGSNESCPECSLSWERWAP